MDRLDILYKRSLDLSAFCDYAVASPPEGQTSNLVNPPSQANIPRIFTYITLPPMVVFLSLRFYTRIFVTRQVGFDDYLCALSAVSDALDELCCHLLHDELTDTARRQW